MFIDQDGGHVTIADTDECFAVVMPAPISPMATVKAKLVSLISAIHNNRHLGQPGDNAYFVVESTEGYVQGLAPPGDICVRLEARSKVDRQAGDQRLIIIGFEPPHEGGVNA